MISVEDWSNGAENSTLFQIEYYFTVSVFTVYYIIRDFFQTYVKKTLPTTHFLMLVYTLLNIFGHYIIPILQFGLFSRFYDFTIII